MDVDQVEATSANFNDEVIWDNNKNLFSIYFKQEMFDNRYRLTLYSVPEENDFETNLYILKTI